MLRLDTLVVLAARRWFFWGEIPGSHPARCSLLFAPQKIGESVQKCSILSKKGEFSKLTYLDVPLEVRING